MIKEGAGKGTNYGNKEVVDYDRVIGEFYDMKSDQYYYTTRATIHYDNKGTAHIVPAAPREFKR